MQKVIVAFENSANSEKIREALESGGLSCLICRSAAEVKRTVRKQGVNIIVCGFKLRDESCEALHYDLPERCSMLMIGRQAQLELCEADGIFKLRNPISRRDLLVSVQMLAQIRRPPVREKAPPVRTGEENALITQAKALLMDRHGMTEEQAHRFLQKQSMDSGTRLAETARLVLAGQ